MPVLGHEHAYEICRRGHGGAVVVRSLATGRVLRSRKGRVSIFDYDLGVPRWVRPEDLLASPTRDDTSLHEEEDEEKCACPCCKVHVSTLPFCHVFVLMLVVAMAAVVMCASASDQGHEQGWWRSDM